jgi:hypothetical protein
MGHVSANNSSASDKFFLAGHGDLPSVQPNSYGHRASSFMSCNPHRMRSHLFSAHVTERIICARFNGPTPAKETADGGSRRTAAIRLWRERPTFRGPFWMGPSDKGEKRSLHCSGSERLPSFVSGLDVGIVDIMLRTYHCSCDRRASRRPAPGPKGEAIALHKEGQHHGDFLR